MLNKKCNCAKCRAIRKQNLKETVQLKFFDEQEQKAEEDVEEYFERVGCFSGGAIWKRK